MTSSFSPLYHQSLGLLTDFYQFTMSYGYWKSGLAGKEAVFHLFFRRAPFNGGFTIAAGLEQVVEFIKNFKFDKSDLDYLSKQKAIDGIAYFPDEFLDYLSELTFTGQIDAVPEGTAVFPFEPLLRIQGPLIECQLLETPLLNLINFPTLIATKAARTCLAAKGDPVIEFGMRRAQGIDGCLTASRAAYIGGCDSTSNVLAGKLYNIPIKGTHSHSWTMVFDDELTSFQTYAEAMPSNCVFLVDTYDTLEGVKKAIKVGKWLKERGKKLLGIRLDSGDLADLSIKSRTLLDQAGFQDAFILASNELDETIISELKRQGANISVWGVGTNLVTARDQPALDGVYKLSAIREPNKEWKYKLKLSEQMTKISNPGILQVRRFYHQEENVADVIYDIEASRMDHCLIVDPVDPTRVQEISGELQFRDLLIPIFRDGQCIYQLPTLQQIRERTKDELSHFTIGIKRFLNPHLYVVGMEKTLSEIKSNLIKKNRHSFIPTPFKEQKT
jgi:nicotinate phosphoribosyltransferase